MTRFNTSGFISPQLVDRFDADAEDGADKNIACWKRKTQDRGSP